MVKAVDFFTIPFSTSEKLVAGGKSFSSTGRKECECSTVFQGLVPFPH
jgi:hypothetical protein